MFSAALLTGKAVSLAVGLQAAICRACSHLLYLDSSEGLGPCC